MTTADKILVWQTVAIWVGAVVSAPLTIWAMFRQTRLAAKLAEGGRRQECLESLLAVYQPGWPQSGRRYYRYLNTIPALFAFDAGVLQEYRTYRDLSVQRDPTRARASYTRLLLKMAAACGVPLTADDLSAAFAEQWRSAS